MKRTNESENANLLAKLDTLQALYATSVNCDDQALDYAAALYANQASALWQHGLTIDINKAQAARWTEYLKMWIAAQSELKAHDALYNTGVQPQWHKTRQELTAQCDRLAWRLWQCDKLIDIDGNKLIDSINSLLTVKRAA